MRNTRILSLLVASSLLTATASAQSALTTEERQDARSDALSGRLALNFQSQYFFRGIRQAGRGVITQPQIDLGWDVWESDDEQRNLRFVVGQFNSLHRDDTFGAGPWYESSFYAGLEGKVAERWDVGVRFNLYSSPSNGAALFKNIEELAFYGQFNDEGLLFDSFSLQPYALLAIELSNQRDGGVGTASQEGTYLELGVAPEFELTHINETPVTLTTPAKIGLSLGDYYERMIAPGPGGNDEFFGFLQFGGVASMPMDFLPGRMGPWTLETGLHLLLLGDNTSDLNSNDSLELIFTVGMSTTF